MTIRGLLAHKLRLALTATAIVLGVTFITGTYILTDTLHGTISSIFASLYQNVDFQVRGVAQFPGSAASAVRNPLPASVLPEIQRVPGVGSAEGQVSGYAQYIGRDGEPIVTAGSSTVGLSYQSDQQIFQMRLTSGRAPAAPGQVAMDSATAQKYGYVVGDRIRILTPKGVQTFTVCGIVSVGGSDGVGGTTVAAFATPTAQSLFGETGEYDDIDVVAAPGADKAAVQRGIAAVLPPGMEVVTGQTVIQEQTGSVDQSVAFFSTALLVFAYIALFVGGFTILNTFSIIVGQRTRELALLRIVGARRRQVFRAVLGEAAIVGLASSLAGIGLGVLTALGLKALLRGFGVSLPPGALVFEARTVIVALAVGVGVTVVAAISPARRAVRIPPIAAISSRQLEGDVPLRRRFVLGASIALLGAAALGAGLSKPAVQLVGLGAAAIFIGVAMLAPAVARPLSGVIGRPFARLFGAAGRLGRENSMRSPRRTAQTASALMVGLALVSAIAVFGASLSKSTTSSVDGAVSADLIVSSTSSSGSGSFSAAVPEAVSGLPGVTASSTIYGGQFEFRQSVETLRAVSTQSLSSTVIMRMTSGSSQALAAGELLIDQTTADSDHLSVGDTVPVKFARTGATTLRIGGIYQPNAALTSYVVGAGYFVAHFSDPLPGAVLLKTDGSAAVQQEVQKALAPYPNVQVQTRDEFDRAQLTLVNQLLGLVYALLGLAVLIALIGIVNTLILSVFERSHEIGLLRAVGMKRRQIRSMIRSEAVILSVFGAVIGVVIGTGLGIALVSALRSQGITEVSLPFSRLVLFLILAALLGLVAAGWPARRAARLDVLAAIAAE
ncbi:MAG TPA: FtsX-like permease family protein [Actinocrinis sp.]